MKNYYFIILSIIVIIYIINAVRHNKLSIKISFGWIVASMFMLFLAIFPYSMDWLAKLLGINYPPALFLTLCVVLLVIIDFNFSKKMEILSKKIIELEQHIAILESEKNERKK